MLTINLFYKTLLFLDLGFTLRYVEGQEEELKETHR